MGTTLTLHGYVNDNILDAMKKITLLVVDVDGTLTDGKITVSGDQEVKSFDSKDGLGMYLLRAYGVQTAIITGRKSEAVDRRAKELKVDHVIQGAKNKKDAVNELKEKLGINTGECACVGDDLNDVPMFECSDFNACPQDAVAYIKTISTYILRSNAGHGAIRELTDLIMIAKGHMNIDGGLKETSRFSKN